MSECTDGFIFPNALRSPSLLDVMAKVMVQQSWMTEKKGQMHELCLTGKKVFTHAQVYSSGGPKFFSLKPKS